MDYYRECHSCIIGATRYFFSNVIVSNGSAKQLFKCEQSGCAGRLEVKVQHPTKSWRLIVGHSGKECRSAFDQAMLELKDIRMSEGGWSNLIGQRPRLGTVTEGDSSASSGHSSLPSIVEQDSLDSTMAAGIQEEEMPTLPYSTSCSDSDSGRSTMGYQESSSSARQRNQGGRRTSANVSSSSTLTGDQLDWSVSTLHDTPATRDLSARVRLTGRYVPTPGPETRGQPKHSTPLPRMLRVRQAVAPLKKPKH